MAKIIDDVIQDMLEIKFLSNALKNAGEEFKDYIGPKSEFYALASLEEQLNALNFEISSKENRSSQEIQEAKEHFQTYKEIFKIVYFDKKIIVPLKTSKAKGGIQTLLPSEDTYVQLHSGLVVERSIAEKTDLDYKTYKPVRLFLCGEFS